MVLAA